MANLKIDVVYEAGNGLIHRFTCYGIKCASVSQIPDSAHTALCKGLGGEFPGVEFRDERRPSPPERAKPKKKRSLGADTGRHQANGGK